MVNLCFYLSIFDAWRSFEGSEKQKVVRTGMAIAHIKTFINPKIEAKILEDVLLGIGHGINLELVA